MSQSSNDLSDKFEIKCSKCNHTGIVFSSFFKTQSIRCSSCGYVFPTALIINKFIISLIFKLRSELLQIENLIAQANIQDNDIYDTVSEHVLVAKDTLELIENIHIKADDYLKINFDKIQKLAEQISYFQNYIHELEKINTELITECDLLEKQVKEKDVDLNQDLF
jgi:uncharacterized Zn finger protein